VHPPELRRQALALVASGMSLNAVSQRLGVGRAALRDWRTRGVDPSAPGCPAQARQGPAYAALLGFYLGDGCLSRQPRTWMLRVSCDEAYPGIVEDVAACLVSVHPARPVFRVRAPGTVVVQGYWNHWPCLFPQHGPGRKHERAIVLADWQEEVVAAHPWDFLRGLLHSDGCRVRNWATRVVAGERRRYEYPRWQFTNESEDIMRLCAWALDLVGVPWRRSSRKTLSVSTRAGVRLLDERVGLKR
jgi:hypothetical protein